MALLLTHDEEQYILDRLSSDSWFLAESIKSKIEADRQRKERFLKCNHIEAHYNGKKSCCAKCGGYFKPGQGETWVLSKKRNIKNSVATQTGSTPSGRKRKASIKKPDGVADLPLQSRMPMVKSD